MLAIGYDELKNDLGKTVLCWICGKRHKVRYGDLIKADGTREKSTLFAYFKCRGKSYMCGINGKECRPNNA